MNRSLLSAITAQLNSGALNYTVFLDYLSLPVKAQENPIQCIRAGLGEHAIVQTLRTVTVEEVIEEVESSLRYSGTEGAGPSKKTLDSPEFKSLLHQLIADLRLTLGGARRIWSFALSEGHPAYPVFWDFAFLLTLPDNVAILIGSSSD